MSKLDVWTVSVMFCTEHGKTRADAFLQGPAVEVECSGWSEPDARTPAGSAHGENVAAARALEVLSRHLLDRAAPIQTR